MRCLVTGATGFVGQRLVSQLRASGAWVRGIARSNATCAAHEFVQADLAGVPADAPWLDDIEVLFHLAAKTHDMTEAEGVAEEYARTNVEGTRRLLASPNADALRRVVFVSSVKAMDEGNLHPADENTAPQPMTPYGRSKLEAEGIVRAFAASSGREAVCLRFPLVYGPDQRGNLQRMIAAIDRGSFPPPPRNGNRRSMLHVDNAVQALMLCGRHPAAAGQVFLVADARPYSTRELYDGIRAALGRRPLAWSVPAWALKAVAAGGDVARMVTGRRIGFDSDALNKLMGSAAYSIAKIERELGYRPVHNLLSSLPSLVTPHPTPDR